MVDEVHYQYLECKHIAKTDFRLFDSQEHYILCQPCREAGQNVYGIAPKTAWKQVTSPNVSEMSFRNDVMRDVPIWDAFLVPGRDVLRIGNGLRPFPYTIYRSDPTKRGFTFR